MPEMTAKQKGRVRDIIAQIAEADVQENGPISDNPKEAYFRGLEAALAFVMDSLMNQGASHA